MVEYHKNKSFTESLEEDEFLRNDRKIYDMADEELFDEYAEDYNEKIYKWLCMGVLIIWIFSMLYL
jgi:hypothetical protein